MSPFTDFFMTRFRPSQPGDEEVVVDDGQRLWVVPARHPGRDLPLRSKHLPDLYTPCRLWHHVYIVQRAHVVLTGASAITRSTTPHPASFGGIRNVPPSRSLKGRFPESCGREGPRAQDPSRAAGACISVISRLPPGRTSTRGSQPETSNVASMNLKK